MGNIVFFVALNLSFCLHLFSSVESQSPKSNESQPGQVYPIHQDSIIRLLNLLVVAWGVGGAPYDSLYGEAPPERGIFSRLQVYERVGISLVGVHKRGGKNLSFGSMEGPKGLTDEFYGFIKSRKRSIFVIDSYIKDRAFTEVKRDTKF